MDTAAVRNAATQFDAGPIRAARAALDKDFDRAQAGRDRWYGDRGALVHQRIEAFKTVLDNWAQASDHCANGLRNSANRVQSTDQGIAAQFSALGADLGSDGSGLTLKPSTS